MKFSKAEVLNLANLAKLKLNKEEVSLYQKQLKDVLIYVNKIKELKLNKIKESLTGVAEANRELRSDKVRSSQPEIIGQACQINDSYMVAPSVFDKEE
ncbi:MAG: Asp-tRNA(Asn)/Glu-tRNA(Gln) amidotransferase GatCAB subunit C [Candidatus Komeilibacteria bacterium CG11_big_fil_rev_8_21_14_0_20_36_20]|uniref:Asp-tRNA(Asn)/Glu-tRNA(Gln) amidotransferase GatCAB subunit C n=1 Tax=Candidatus Komeilibacteria bacterium CG11_big_fil_rev_8_21_14_0_20_36_20 TaxID=1974477 RepID=A0A2H0ND93_9BACT|nr:MAG: Asp-tRNA(Asn)/Glu-tRNA(Gln) amidotransferase GatCAB subunit C [Candidatus Komeilibacteria bacterium CG11_big_fil_rev_8_21_14_0_20_36_20]PIR81581.1 MAG: Asp-tRNA(Asn)/Glu-tRNA(Gln) amidotransferase GatCAB subunit C [Candidatus Komeilibacteria bacterium CG10_big_fil_rev_8_21_14_0_10_36_65]PJC55419.1 MAG: Asp-tRNA(Asn)/Glu-tRNA(Gln) amidotransferase GatCAB subunit C [Candidatus Komeilibacteria bacterium CG_4_9_14_0_2_um_filter_36_13]